MPIFPSPQKIKVKRSELRQKQSAVFRRATGRRIVEVSGGHRDRPKYVVDKEYLDGLLERLRATLETLEITADIRLYRQILRAAETLDEDVRKGRLHSWQEAFGEE